MTTRFIVYPNAWNVVTARVVSRAGWGPVYWSTHAVAIVLADEDDG